MATVSERLIHNHSTGALYFAGVNTGVMTLLGESDDEKILVLHKAGRHYHGGTGRPQEYAPARIVVYKWSSKETPTNDQTVYHIGSTRGIIEFPAARRKS